MSYLLLADAKSVIAPMARSPLILPPGAFSETLPWTPPKHRDYLRGDAWGITMPEAPWVPGASSRHYERVLSWFLDRYPLDFQQKYLRRIVEYQYTHIKLSAGDSLGPINNGDPNVNPPGAGQTLAQFIETCRRAKQVVPYVQVMLKSKNFTWFEGRIADCPNNCTPDQFKAYAEPIMDALTSAGVVDEFIPMWEMDLAMQQAPGQPTIDICKWVGQKAHAAGCSCWLHFSPEKTSWFADGDPRQRFGFWDDVGSDVDGLNYQTVPSWDIREAQDRIVDTLWQFGLRGNRHKMRVDEDKAAEMWDHNHPTEDEANAYGYLNCCTFDNVRHTDAKVWGFGNGGRMPDGSAL